MILNNAFYSVLRGAAERMLSFQHPAVYEKEGHANYVTEADESVQQFLLEQLHQLYPSASFKAEEGEGSVLKDDPTFIIDPIDGTTNYFRNRSASVISVGLVEGKWTIAGAVFDPYRNLMYHAERGEGAFCNDSPIHVSDFPLERALIEFGSAPYRSDLNALTAHTLQLILPRTADIRRSGSAALDLCTLASGHSEGMFEWNLQPWDYCAASLLVEEAGGRTGNILGGEISFDEGIPFMAGNAVCFEALRELLQRAKRETAIQ